MDSSDTSLGKRPVPADATATEPDAKAPRRGASPKRGKAKEKSPPRDKRRGTRTEPRADDAERAPRLPKRQCALLIGFAGTGYSGMQIQNGVATRTIEGTLFEALVKAGAVSQDNADDPVKVNLGRAARTDAGVHAAGNIVSLKMICEIPGVPDVTARINELLPPEIRLWSFTRVQNSFNARLSCDSRKYTYFFPSYMLIPPKPGSGLGETHKRLAAESAPPHPFWADAGLESEPEEDLRRKRAWRCAPEHVEALRATVARYERSHNFHNFTVGRDFNDRSAQRNMKSIQIEDPVVYGDTEWIAVLFHGQSFMLHQRKMMTVLVLSCRMGTPSQIIDELYGPRNVTVPKMPALGLLLEHPLFDNYNRKVDGLNAALPGPDAPEWRAPLDFEAHRAAIDAFKQAFIYGSMRAIEDKTGLFDAWVRHLDKYTGDDLNWLFAQGSIPDSAVLTRGTRRANRFREKRRFDMTGFTQPDGSLKDVNFQEDEGSGDEGSGDEEVKMDKKTLAEMEG